MKSAKITNLSFLLALGIVWQHSRLPLWPSTMAYPQFMLILQFTNKMMEVVVPCFFFISGYLFFRNYTPADFLKKLRTRLRSLLVPYLLWNTIFAAAWYVAIQFIPDFVSDRFPYDSILDVIVGILSCQYSVLWYVGVIFVYALFAPLLWLMVRRKKLFPVWLIVTCVICLVFRHPFCSPVLWLPIYLAGAYAGVHHKDFLFGEQPLFLTLPSLIIFPIAFYWDYLWHNNVSMNIVQWIGPTLCIGLYDIVNRLHTIPSLSFFKYSFFLYAMHYMPLHIIERMCLMQWTHPYAPYVAYFGAPLVVTVFVILMARLTDRHLHPLYSLLSGGR